MEDNHYKTDKLQVIENAMAVATEKINFIEVNFNMKPIAFIAANSQNAKIRTRITEPNFRMFIGLIMTKVCALAGIKSEISDFDKQDILKMIFSRFDDLTAEELVKAFEFERYSVYDVKTDHFQLFNATYVGEILKKYKNWKQLVRINHNIPIGSDMQLVQNTESADKEFMIKGILSRFEQYQRGEKIETPLLHIFNDLRDRNIFPSDMPDAEIYKVALRETKEELETIKAKSRSERREIKEALEKLEKKMVSEKVLIKARLLAVEYFFKKVIDDKLNINELIRNNKTKL